MKTVNPIYSLAMLLLFAISITSCSEDLGYDIQDVTLEQQEIPKEEKVFKKAAPKKRTSSIKAAPKKRTKLTQQVLDGEISKPEVLPDTRQGLNP